MNLRFVLRQLGLLMIVLCVCMGLATLWSAAQWWWRDDALEKMAMLALLAGIAIGFAAGGILWLFGHRGGFEFMGRREALLLVALAWAFGAAIAALPFYLWAMLDTTIAPGHAFGSFVNCYFESMSGFTTTGATVLAEVESMPQGLLLWRAMTQWLGGLGIVVLFVAVLPMLGVGGKRLFQVEAAGPKQAGVRPRIADTARTLWLIYLGLTVASILLLHWAGRMDWFDSLCHTFATLATGGFSTQNASIGAYHNRLAIDIITIVFMIFAGINFGLYDHLLKGRGSLVWRDPELRLYLILIAVATLIITICLIGRTIVLTDGTQIEQAGTFEAVRQSLFQVVSIQTTTGYATADFNLWSFLPKAILITLMFVGGSAGSTGGGIKVIRILVMFKVMWAEVERAFRPNVVRTVRVGKGVVDPAMRLSVIVYVLGIVLLTGAGAVTLMLLEPTGAIDFVTASTASIATINNIGPGLGSVGATENYGHFTDASKIVMSVLMALGRLEIFAVLVLLMPGFWRGD